jgi:hypothetical protein
MSIRQLRSTTSFWKKRGMLFRGMLSLAHGLVTPEITQAL